jgi:hypothetical protein
VNGYPVRKPENGSESSDGQRRPIGSEAASLPLQVGSFSIDDAIQMHLVDCDQCREMTERSGPVKMGERSGHCAEYWHLQILRANYEGQVNNIVAHTEYGDEAPKLGSLE